MTPPRKGKGKQPAAPWADLAPDALQHMALLLPPRDRCGLGGPPSPGCRTRVVGQCTPF